MKSFAFLATLLTASALAASTFAAPTLTRHPAQKPAVQMRLDQVKSAAATPNQCATSGFAASKTAVQHRVGSPATTAAGACELGEFIASKPATRALQKTAPTVVIRDGAMSVASAAITPHF